MLSSRFSTGAAMDKEFWVKNLKSLGIALAGAALVFVSDTLIPQLQSLNTSQAALLGTLLAFGVNAVRLYITTPTKKVAK